MAGLTLPNHPHNLRGLLLADWISAPDVQTSMTSWEVRSAQSLSLILGRFLPGFLELTGIVSSFFSILEQLGGKYSVFDSTFCRPYA